jgi:hypothetical protein
MTEIMELMLDLAVKITGAQFAGAALMGMSDEIFLSGLDHEKGRGKFPLDTGFSRASGLSGLLIRTKECHICNITDGDRYLNEDVKAEFKIKNYISVPLLAKNRNFLGLMEIYNKGNFEPFNGNDAEILSTLASFTATSIERFRVFVEYGKFGDEVQKIVDETIEAESALKNECDKYEATKRELETIRKSARKARMIAESMLDLSEEKAVKEKTAAIIKVLSNE